MAPTVRTAYDTWAAVAIPVASPFAAAELLPTRGLASDFCLYRCIEVKINVYLVLLTFSLATGCSSGFGFVPTNLEPVKANLEYWEKPSMTGENRLADSAQCGGGYTFHTGFRPETIRAAQRAGETERDTDFRLFHDWQRCMLKKGYRSAQKCYDNEISRAMPACGAP